MDTDLFSIEEGAVRYHISVRTLRRRIKDGSLIPAGYRTGARGQKVALFRGEDIRRIGRGKSRPGSWEAFFYSCIASGCAPRLTLQKLLLTPVDIPGAVAYYDIDFAHAAMKLVFDEDPDFLHMLSDQWALKPNFASEIARALGPERRIRLGEAPEEESQFGMFENVFTRLKRLYVKGEICSVSGESFPVIADLDLLCRSRPRYLERINCWTIPAWAQKSVMPFREGRDVRSAMEEVKKKSDKNRRLKAFLHSIERDIESLALSAWKVKPVEQVSVRKATKKSGRLESTPWDSAVAAGISRLIDDLVNHYNIPRATARRYCWGLHRRIHADQYKILRQAQQKDWTGPVGVKKLPRAVVNRIFCASRSAKI